MKYGVGLSLFLLLGCTAPERPGVSERLAASEQQHQAQLNEAFAPPAPSRPEPVSRAAAGPPAWSQAFPESCQATEWCGFAVVDACATPFACRNEAELQASRDLLCSISSRIRDRTIRRTQRTLTESGEETGVLTYSQEVRERCADVPLREVRFEHAYWEAQQQHFTLARMLRPPPPPPASEARPTRLFRVAPGFSEAPILKDWLQEEGRLAAVEATEAWTLGASVAYELKPHDGTLFHGTATATLTLTLEHPDAPPRSERRWVIRRLLVPNPETLSAAQRAEAQEKTLRKGLSEFRAELLAFLQGDALK